MAKVAYNYSVINSIDEAAKPFAYPLNDPGSVYRADVRIGQLQ